ncbi:hypothetical protein GGR56DRAFT_647771 [Xylariaceae sp. FL0804]|nr:hypothetical protein GGR56DRAFT_647771 [Xylariaceae sp. FL0804]
MYGLSPLKLLLVPGLLKSLSALLFPLDRELQIGAREREKREHLQQPKCEQPTGHDLVPDLSVSSTAYLPIAAIQP